MHSTINRRQFIQNSLLTSAGLMIMPPFLSSASPSRAVDKSFNLNNAGLTPIALMDNACLLAFCSGRLSQETQNAISTDIHLRNTAGNKGRLAGVLPARDKKLMELIEIVRTNPETKHRDEKMAIAFGWVSINALDRHVNGAFKDKNEEDMMLARMHQDALLIKGFSSPEFDVTQAAKKDIEHMLKTLMVRTITRTHTLKPDMQDGIGWVNRMADWRRQNEKLMGKFADAIVNPDSAIAGISFYNPDDKIITTANQLQNNQTVPPSAIIKSIKAANEGQTSDFAKAMAEATENMLAIDEYWENKSSKEELIKKLELH